MVPWKHCMHYGTLSIGKLRGYITSTNTTFATTHLRPLAPLPCILRTSFEWVLLSTPNPYRLQPYTKMVILFRHFLSYLAYKTQVLFRVSLLVSWYFLEIPLLLQERVDEKSLYKCYQVQFCYYCAARWAPCTISFWSKKSPNSVGAFVHIGNCIPILSTIRPFLFEVCHLQAYFMLKWPTSQLLMWCLKKWPNCAQNWYRNTFN